VIEGIVESRLEGGGLESLEARRCMDRPGQDELDCERTPLWRHGNYIE